MLTSEAARRNQHNTALPQHLPAMTLLDAHLEQISLCSASIAELPSVHTPNPAHLPIQLTQTPQLSSAQDIHKRPAPPARNHDPNPRHRIARARPLLRPPSPQARRLPARTLALHFQQQPQPPQYRLQCQHQWQRQYRRRRRQCRARSPPQHRRRCHPGLRAGRAHPRGRRRRRRERPGVSRVRRRQGSGRDRRGKLAGGGREAVWSVVSHYSASWIL